MGIHKLQCPPFSLLLCFFGEATQQASQRTPNISKKDTKERPLWEDGARLQRIWGAGQQEARDGGRERGGGRVGGLIMNIS